jgi:DNA repair exonuclease SbcCD ATPase subunit
MSQTETLMLVALGFALCALLVLLLGRAFWNLAVRLGSAKNARKIPVAMLDLQADRDRLRVEHAMMSRKLELRLQDIKMRMTEQMAEVSRSRNRVQTLVQDLTAKTASLATREKDLESLNSQIAAYKADLVSCTETIKHLTTTTVTLQDENRKLTSKLTETQSALKLIELSDSKSALQLGTGTSPISVVATPFKETTSEDRIKQRISELTNLSSEMTSRTEAPSTTLPATVPNDSRPLTGTLDDKFAEAEREANAMSEELRSLDKMLQTVTSKTEDAPKAPEIETPPTSSEDEPAKSGAVANVISLAQRIKALQFGQKE